MASIGVDLGTTSIKICVVDRGEIVAESQECHNANLEGQKGVQDAERIVEVASRLIQNVVTSLRESHKIVCKSIRIAGQMHGIVFWNGRKMAKGEIECSPVYTWMYPNKPGFMDRVPRPTSGEVYPGYGGATLFEFAAELKTGKYSNLDRCGTIMDMFACFLTGRVDVIMSSQLSPCWGYCSGRNWDTVLEDATKNAVNLPTISEYDVILGEVTSRLGPLEGCSIRQCMGDLQASVRSVEHQSDSEAAYIVIGTSAQLCVIRPSASLKDYSPILKDCRSMQYLPYSPTTVLMAACAMNGGNAVDSFIQLVSNWSNELHGKNPTTSSVDVSRIMSLVDGDDDTEVRATCNFMNERGSEGEGAGINGMNNNTSAIQVIRAICSDVVRNLFCLFPPESLHSLVVRRLVLVGAAKKPRYLREIREICKQFDFSIEESERDTSAAYGAAIFKCE